MSLDYKNAQIKHLLEDQSVLSLLEAVKEYPMASIEDLAAKSAVGNSGHLSVQEARVILSRLEISSQSQRVANFPKVLKMIQKIKTKKSSETIKETHEIAETAEAATEPEVIEAVPDIEIADDPQPQASEVRSILNEQTQNHIENLVKLNEKPPPGQKKKLNLLPKLKFTASPIYFVIIFLLLIALIYWLFTSQFYSSDSSLLQDSSLPVSP